MSLDNFYSLRKNFIIIGLTGKMKSGADKLVEILSQETLKPEQKTFINEFQEVYKEISDSEARKVRRINDFFEFKENWKKFDVIEYKNVVLLFILHHCYSPDKKQYAEKICKWITELGTYKNDNGDFITPRFCSEKGIAEGSTHFINNDFKNFLINHLNLIVQLNLNDDSLIKILKKESNKFKEEEEKNDFFFSDDFQEFASLFFNKLDEFSIYLRHKFIHIATYCLRRFNTLSIDIIKADNVSDEPQNIYVIADAINQIIKIHRDCSDEKAQIIIDRLKNSYEMMYFREKYSGFYMVVNNRKEEDRLNDIQEKVFSIKSITYKEDNLKLIKDLDEVEYKINEFKKGKFDSFDIENCVQKADYHIWYDDKYNEINMYKILTKKDKNNKSPLESLNKTNEYYVYQPFLIQILKLVSLIQQPGLITPTYIERTMQITFNAKLNSGCISRQVGAVVTDSHFSVKGIGWNEVPVGQVPCSLRDVRDLVNGQNLNIFSEFEKGGGDFKYVDKESFLEKIKVDFSEKREDLDNNLKGRPCSFCFKTFHNKYEAKDNQIHNRSLHAEENAMLQIVKYGGQPLLGGNLFTTASPCELCSKKAYQLGIRNVFYIDLYPGIAQKQILEAGKNERTNPTLYHFSGAVGRGFQKLYEPFMAIKDETVLRSKIEPSESDLAKAKQIKNLISKNLDNDKNKELKKALDGIGDKTTVINEMIELMNLGLEVKRKNDKKT